MMRGADPIARELQASLYAVRYAWPLIRPLIKHKLTQRCTRCGLNERHAPLTQGLCPICSVPEPAPTRPPALTLSPRLSTSYLTTTPAEELNEYLRNLQGAGTGNYDVLLFFSGGKDSIYLLERLRSEFKALRILAFTVDNGYRSPFGRDNGERICRHLNVDHLELRPYTAFNKLYRYGFSHLSQRSFVCVDFWEGELFQDVGRTLAAQLGIPAMVLGYTPQQRSLIPAEFDTYHLYKSPKAINRDSQFFTRQHYLDIELSSVFTESERRYWWDASLWPANRVPTMLFPFSAWGYRKTEVLRVAETVTSAVGGTVSPELTNDLYCTLGILLDYKILGYFSMEPEFARMVREGEEDYVYNRNTWEFFEYLALDHFDRMLNAPVTRYCLQRMQLNNASVHSWLAP